MQNGGIVIYKAYQFIGYGNRMLGLAAAFILARALNRAFLVDWEKFTDEDSTVVYNMRRRESASLDDLFHSPCFDWDLHSKSNNKNILMAKKFLIDLTVDKTDIYGEIYHCDLDSWSEHEVIEIKAFHDFSTALMLNPAFKTFAARFPGNDQMSAREPTVPGPSTLMVRYLFTPNLQRYGQNITDEFQRFKQEVRTHCVDSSFYGLHLRLRTLFASRESTYFPCLGGLSAFTGQTCYFIATDSHSSSAEVVPHLPPNSRLLYLHLSRSRDSFEGIRTGLLELFVLASSSMMFGFYHSTFIVAAGAISGSLVYWRDCGTSESPGPKPVCYKQQAMRLGLNSTFDNIVENAFEQRHRFGCVVREAFQRGTLDEYDALSDEQIIKRNPKAVLLQPIRACVVYLLTSSSQIGDFVNISLASLHKNMFLPLDQQYSVIVFTHSVPKSSIDSMLPSMYSEMLTIVDLEPWIPAPSHSSSSTQAAQEMASYPLEYHIKRFHSGLIFTHPALDKYDYIMRLDSRTSIKSPVTRNPFRRMLNHALNYVHPGAPTTSMDSIAGLNEFAKAYVRNNSVRPVHLHEFILSSGHLRPLEYATHFEIMRKEFFLNSQYHHFFQAVDKDMGLHTHGWSEGAIKHLGIAIFANPASVKEFSEEVPTSH